MKGYIRLSKAIEIDNMIINPKSSKILEAQTNFIDVCVTKVNKKRVVANVSGDCINDFIFFGEENVIFKIDRLQLHLENI